MKWVSFGIIYIFFIIPVFMANNRNSSNFDYGSGRIIIDWQKLVFLQKI